MAKGLDFKLKSFTMIELTITLFLTSILITVFIIGIANLKKTFLNLSTVLTEKNQLNALNAQLLTDFYLSNNVSVLSKDVLIMHQTGKEIRYEIKNNLLTRTQKFNQILYKLRFDSIEKKDSLNASYYTFTFFLKKEKITLKFKPLTTFNQTEYQFN
jgi:hypothetical protein